MQFLYKSIKTDQDIFTAKNLKQICTYEQQFYNHKDYDDYCTLTYPTGCKNMDMGKYKYDLQKKANLAKKKQKVATLKEIKLRPGTDTHDYNFKIKNAKKFITKGDKVKFTVKFKGREMQHTELGKELMNKIIEETKEIAKVESRPKFEGRQMVMII